MISFNRDAFRDALNADGEFSVTSEFWNADVRLGLGEFVSILKIRDGRVVEIRESAENESTDLDLVGPESEWHRALEPVPPPYYHHVFSAVCFHDISWRGDVVGGFAYLGALNRMVDLLREHAHIS